MQDIISHNFALLIPLMGMLIPIVAIVGAFLSKAHKERMRHDTIRELAKAGQPIPPALLGKDAFRDSDLDGGSLTRSPTAGLRSAVVNLSVGLGLMGMFAVMRPGSWLWAIGLIPACLGVGLLLLWAVERRTATPPQA